MRGLTVAHGSYEREMKHCLDVHRCKLAGPSCSTSLISLRNRCIGRLAIDLSELRAVWLGEKMGGGEVPMHGVMYIAGTLISLFSPSASASVLLFPVAIYIAETTGLEAGRVAATLAVRRVCWESGSTNPDCTVRYHKICWADLSETAHRTRNGRVAAPPISSPAGGCQLSDVATRSSGRSRRLCSNRGIFRGSPARVCPASTRHGRSGARGSRSGGLVVGACTGTGFDVRCHRRWARDRCEARASSGKRWAGTFKGSQIRHHGRR